MILGGRRQRDYSSSSYTSESRSPPKRRKSFGDAALAALGAGGLVKAVGDRRDKSRDRDRDRDYRDRSYGRGGRDRDRDRDRHRRRYSSSDSSRSRSVDPKAKYQQAAKAALTAAAAEAFRSRKEPGPWTGDKGKRILTAAIGAGGIDKLVSSDKDPDKKGKLHTIEAVIGGLAGNRILNGPVDKSRSRSRSRGGYRSRSRGHDRRDDKGGGGALEALAGTGLAAAAGKMLLDKVQNRSRGRSRSSSADSYDSRRPKRSKSVTDYARQGIAALGIGGKDKKSRRDYDSDDDDDRYGRRSGGRLRGGGGEGGVGVGSRSSSRGSNGGKSNSSSSCPDCSSSEDERRQKKMRGKEWLTAGLASVATIHAAHNVYQSYEGRQQRLKLVKEGEMTHEEANKLKKKARLKDAASIGIAAIGIKGAVSEWKEVTEQRHEFLEFEKKKQRRHEKRTKMLERQARAHQYDSDQGYPSQTAVSEPIMNSALPVAPHYANDNPFGGYPSAGQLPPPPVAPHSDHY